MPLQSISPLWCDETESFRFKAQSPVAEAQLPFKHTVPDQQSLTEASERIDGSAAGLSHLSGAGAWVMSMRTRSAESPSMRPSLKMTSFRR